MRPLRTVTASWRSQNLYTTYKTFSARQPFIPCFSITPIMERTNTTERLSKLRSLMKENNVDIYIVPSEDSHASEYVSEDFSRREYISGFTGSAGWAVIAPNEAILSTDGRYFNQAGKELDDNWTLLKQMVPGVPTWQEWAAERAKDGKTVAVDPTLLTNNVAKKLGDIIEGGGAAPLVGLTENLVDKVWGSERPKPPSKPVKIHPEQYAGKSVQAKLTDLRAEMAKKRCPGFFVTMLDEIAWLFNLRGDDVTYNPVFYSYAIITPEEALLYVDPSKVDSSVSEHLKSNDVQVKPYDSFFADVDERSKHSGGEQGGKFQMAVEGSWALKKALGGDSKVDQVKSPIAVAKAAKNDVELKGMRDCHVRDGAALIKFFAWLEDQIVAKKASVDEVQASEQLNVFRSQQDLFVSDSFEAISSTGANAAVIHYAPKPGKCSVIDPNAVYLCDSGAQYLDGTTDTTRTVHFGTPSAKEREMYTLVLKGLIRLDQTLFPAGTTGYYIDCIARLDLWDKGLDFPHSTGHGVGSFLNVHEGPMGIGGRITNTENALAAGNVLSNEPGYYEDGAFGIRIENIFIVKNIEETTYKLKDKRFLGFENVTMVPYCNNLIDSSLLTQREKDWVNEMNRQTIEKTRNLLQDDALALDWLKRNTEPLV